MTFRRNKLHITKLPARTAVAEVTLYRVTKLDRATPKRAYALSARIARTDAAPETLRATPRPPR